MRFEQEGRNNHYHMDSHLIEKSMPGSGTRKKVDLSLYDNSWYQPGSKVKRLLWFFVNIIVFKNPFNTLYGFKVWILRLFGAEVGHSVIIKPSVNIKYPWFIKMGNQIWIGENVWLDNHTDIQIGNNVCISQGATLMTGNHNYKKPGFDLLVGKITLDDGVWIGAGSMVCPNVHCRSHSVLAVGSIATKDLEAYKIYQGNPAKEVREREIR